MVLELASPPWHVQAVSRNDLGPYQDLPVEGPYEGTQLTCALPGRCVKHGFEVLAEVGAVASTFQDRTIRTCEWVKKLSERAVGKRLPVPERFFCGFGPETGPLQPTKVCCARSCKATNERVPSPPPGADREIAP